MVFGERGGKMSRLTEKVKNTDDYIKLATKDKQEFINKLGKLEDLEEQLGCPLEVYVDLHKIASVYTKMGKCKLLKILDQFIVVKVNDNTTYLPLSDYKKTWFLREDKSE